ncbi:MAG: hypothetical protein ACRDTD_22340, partial [Pseudonocardiaceae bacterium]
MSLSVSAATSAISVAADDTLGEPLLGGVVFAAFVVITLIVVVAVSRRSASATDYFAAGRSFSGAQNGVAISGDYLSAASFLGVT